MNTVHYVTRDVHNSDQLRRKASPAWVCDPRQVPWAMGSHGIEGNITIENERRPVTYIVLEWRMAVARDARSGRYPITIYSEQLDFPSLSHLD